MRNLKGLQAGKQRKWLVGGLVASALLAVVIWAGALLFHHHDPYAQLKEITLVKDMVITEVISKLGKPDSYEDGYGGRSTIRSSYLSSNRTTIYTHYIEILGYGPFGAYHPVAGSITKYRLQMFFSDGELFKWESSAPMSKE